MNTDGQSSLKKPRKVIKIDDPIKRFHLKIIKTENDCHLWTGGKNQKGYAGFYIRNKRYSAHRWIYEQKIGKIQEGLELDHLCRNRNCVNVKHLEPVTHTENVRRGFSASGINYRKTNCKNGHEFNSQNTIFYKDGRRCRICTNDVARKNYFLRKLKKKTGVN